MSLSCICQCVHILNLTIVSGSDTAPWACGDPLVRESSYPLRCSRPSIAWTRRHEHHGQMNTAKVPAVRGGVHVFEADWKWSRGFVARRCRLGAAQSVAWTKADDGRRNHWAFGSL